MRKFIGYVLSPLHYLAFGFLLLLFHPIQWICLKTGGYTAHKRSVDVLNFLILKTYALLGNTVQFNNPQQLPQNRSIIFIANHQSMYDIPPLIYHLRKYHAKFISKIELTKGIPSISFNLRHSGAANINRSDPKQSISEILKLGKNMHDKKWSAVIFPEGTRAKTGQLKPFAVGGVSTLLKKAPEALVVPIAICNSWKMVRYGQFPLNTFLTLSWNVLEPIEPKGMDPEEVVKEAEKRIRKFLGQEEKFS